MPCRFPGSAKGADGLRIVAIGPGVEFALLTSGGYLKCFGSDQYGAGQLPRMASHFPGRFARPVSIE